jgi:hypothetical protein
MKQPKTVFDWMKEMTFTKSPSEIFDDESWNTFNTFMVHRFISMYQPYIETVNYIQGLDIKDKKQIYEIYKELLPKKSIFAKYIKNQTENTSTSLAEHISLYYQVSLREATNYINILPTEVIKEILEELGVEEKEIKKLTKVGKEKQNTK